MLDFAAKRHSILGLEVSAVAFNPSFFAVGRAKFFVFLLALALGFGTSPTTLHGQLERLGKKLPEPERAAQERAETLLRSTFKSDYARRQPREMREFALRLFQQGMETNDDPAA